MVVTQAPSTKKKKKYTLCRSESYRNKCFHERLHTPKTFQWACICARVYTHAGEGRKGEKKAGADLQKEVLFPVYFWKMFVSACPHVFHGKDLGGNQSMGWIWAPGGCPYHGLQARISRRIPAATALNPETTCPGYTNTLPVFHLDQLFLLTNSPACSNGGPKRLGSEQAVVFQNKGPHLKHKICSRETWKLSTGVPESGKGSTFDTKPLTQKYFLLLKSEGK